MFFKVDFIAVASASQAGKPERLTLWALLFKKRLFWTVLCSTISFLEQLLFFALQEETGYGTEMDYCKFFNV